MVKVYGYKKCSTVNKAIKYLEGYHTKVEFYDFVANKMDEEVLRSIIRESGQSVDVFFNSRGKVFKELALKDKLSQLNDDKKIALLLSDGLLIKRPLIVIDEHVFIGFNEKELSEFIKIHKQI